MAAAVRPVDRGSGRLGDGRPGDLRAALISAPILDVNEAATSVAGRRCVCSPPAEIER